MPDQTASRRDSTIAGIPEQQRGVGSRLASRAFMLVLLLVCVAGGVGLLGGHTATATTDRDGYQLALSYPGTARPGLDTFWELHISHEGGFKKSITIAVTGSYFDLFETQGFYPTPSATTRDATDVYMTFTPPRHGDTLTVMYDAYAQPYIAPSHLLGQDATVALIDHGKPVVTLPFTVWMFP
jgi:hypothetical protein